VTTRSLLSFTGHYANYINAIALSTQLVRFLLGTLLSEVVFASKSSFYPAIHWDLSELHVQFIPTWIKPKYFHLPARRSIVLLARIQQLTLHAIEIAHRLLLLLRIAHKIELDLIDYMNIYAAINTLRVSRARLLIVSIDIVI